MRLFSTGAKRYVKKVPAVKKVSRFFLPGQLDYYPHLSESKFGKTEQAEFLDDGPEFEEAFSNHSTMVDIEGMAILAKEIHTDLGYIYDASHKETFRVPDSLSTLDSSQTDLATLKKVNEVLKEKSATLENFEAIKNLVSVTKENASRVPIRVEKSKLEIIKGRLVPRPNTNSSSEHRNLSQIDRASLFMLHESLTSDVFLPGRILSISEESGLRVGVGSIIRHLAVSSVIPTSLRVYCGIPQETVMKKLEQLRYHVVKVKVTLKPSIELPGIDLHPTELADAVADHRVRLVLAAWADSSQYSLLPKPIMELISQSDYDGYHQRYGFVSPQPRERVTSDS